MPYSFRALVAILLLAATAPMLRAAEAAKLPWAEAAEARRGKTALSKLAAEMKPGTWAELKTEGLDSKVLKAPPPSKGLDIMGWTDDGAWDSRTGQFLFMGLRQTRRFIAYSEEKNAWRELPIEGGDQAPQKVSQYGHIYSRNALDPDASRYYHMDNNATPGIFRFDLNTETWTRLPAGGQYQMTGVIEYFSARKGLLNRGEGKGNLMFFSEEKQAWEDLGKIDVHGYQSLGRDNPIREEVLFLGGNQSPKAVVRVTKDGRTERMKDCPVEATIRFEKLAVDPLSGKYLLLAEKKFYEFDSATNEWTLLDDFEKSPSPFSKYDQPIVACVPEYGVTMWVANSGVRLYKHGPAAAKAAHAETDKDAAAQK